MNKLFETDIETGAQFSGCRAWRYALWRTWDASYGHCMFIGLNPSTADETEDDPTIRRCINFAKSWGFGGIHMLNLFAFRATLPSDMKAAADPIGPENNEFLTMYAKQSEKIVCAWGVNGKFKSRDGYVTAMLSDFDLFCLGSTNTGQPKHPLYLKSDTPLERFP